MKEQKINCPNCSGDIVFDVYSLIEGRAFVCDTCNATIKLSSESKTQVSESIEEFEKLKRSAAN